MLLPPLQMSDSQDLMNGPGGTTVWHGANTLLLRTAQMAGLQTGCVVEYGGFEVVPGAVVATGGVVGVTQGVPGTSHWPAESEQFATWPFG